MRNDEIVSREAVLSALRSIEMAHCYVLAMRDELAAMLSIDKHMSQFDPADLTYYTTDVRLVRDAMKDALQLLGAYDM